jgi:DHA2 family multidrug resistance protein-like MFS transporter
MKERGAAQAKMMMISMTITAFAPAIIGIIIQAVSWPITYLLTAAAGVIALFFASKTKYDQKLAEKKPFDIIGSVLLFLFISLLTMGIMRAGDAGLTSPSVLIMVGAGLIVGVILVMVSLRKENPLIQFRLFQIKTVSIAVFVVFMNYLPNVLMGAFVARFVQQALGLSPTATGLLMIVPVLMIVVAAPFGGKMLDQGGPRKPVILGISLLAGGLVFLGFGFLAQNLWLVLLGAAIGGAGFSLTNPVQMAALSVTPFEQRGMLAGIFPVATNFSTAFFVALLTAGMGIFMTDYQVANPGAAEADAMSYALSILSLIGLIGTVVTLLVSFRLPKIIEASSDLSVNTSASPAND